MNKELDDITEIDIQHLIDEEIIEKKTLEYKSELPGNTDSEKKDFLADVSSFVNANGGIIIYGVSEDRSTGKPIGPLEGIKISNADQEKLRLEHTLGSGIEPSITSFCEVREMALSNGNYLFIIRIRRSWRGPHRISFKNSHKFYSRHSSGNFILDVEELRSAFILSESLAEKIKMFREERISKIYANELPILFYPSAKIALHLIPPNSFRLGHVLDRKKLSLYDIQPMGSSSFNNRYNIDGFLTYSNFNYKDRSYSYTLLFRNGIIEAVNSEMLWPGEGERIIPMTLIEKELLDKVPKYIGVFEKLGIDSPIFLFLTFVEVKDYISPRNTPYWSRDIYPIDRDVLFIPEIIIEDFDYEPTQLLRPIFDSIWNACGYERSFNYTREGEWKPNN